jgi:hypothetical protein
MILGYICSCTYEACGHDWLGGRRGEERKGGERNIHGPLFLDGMPGVIEARKLGRCRSDRLRDYGILKDDYCSCPSHVCCSEALVPVFDGFL